MKNKIVVVIPAYEPEDSLVGLISSLQPDFGRIVVYPRECRLGIILLSPSVDDIVCEIETFRDVHPVVSLEILV